MTFAKPTIVLADDYHPVLARIASLLEPDYCVLALVENGSQAVQAVDTMKPDLLLLDIAMPVMDGITAARAILRTGVRTRIIFLSAQLDPEYFELAQSMGASFVLKNHLQTELLPAIAEVLAGRTYYSITLSSMSR